MPDFGLFGGMAMQEAATTGTSTAIAVADASSDTKGSWTELISSTTYPTAWMLVHLVSQTSTDAFIVDIGIGAAASEKVLIPDIVHRGSPGGTGSSIGRNILLPISIRSGVRLSARCASSTSAADTTHVGLTLIAPTLSGPSPLSQCEGFGSVVSGSTATAIDPGGSANTLGAWVQLIASTTFAYKWMCLEVLGNNIPSVGPNYLLDIGIGAAASEKVLIPKLPFINTVNVDMVTPGSVCLPVSVPLGSRLSARCQASVNTATERNLLVAGQGVG